MTSDSIFLSQTLQSITTTKKREHIKRKKAFETRKNQLLKAAEETPDHRERLKILLSAVENESLNYKGFSHLNHDRQTELQNIGRYIEQSQHDPSITRDILDEFESTLRLKLEQEGQRHEFADLYYRLLAEWAESASEPIANSEKTSLDGPFEHVEKDRLQQLTEKFAKVVFTPLSTDEIEIDNYLSSLFEDDHAEEILKKLRNDMKQFGQNFKKQTNPFSQEIIESCIEALLKNDLLNDGAKMTLHEIGANDIVLEEISDVLNLRFSDLDSWTWEEDQGMYYEPRRQPNGKYRIMMDQNILQAIFLHYIATNWCSEFHKVFERFPSDSKFWKTLPRMTHEETLRNSYFTSERRGNLNGNEHRKHTSYQKYFFISSLPKSLEDTCDAYEQDPDEEEDEEKRPRSGAVIRQKLLHEIATDVIIRRELYGDVVVLQSDLQWYASGLPHSSIFAVLRFWGVSEDWIQFFQKFAEAPLRMSEIPGIDVRIRKRGIPITDAFEKLFGEVVLFGMDLAVNRLAEAVLYRFHDDLWLSGEPGRCVAAWETIKDYVAVLGLDINTRKTGSVYLSKKEKDPEIENKLPDGDVCMGMLKLNDSWEWAIDRPQVDAHIRQLQKQLGACTSILSWVQTWNSCMGRFFQNTFGSPANCFGQAHVDQILETHARMQRELFDNTATGSVMEYLRNLISSRLGFDDVPDCFFFLPEELGGLGLQNPFVTFFNLRNQVYKNPQDRVKQFREEEAKAYSNAKKAFDSLSDSDKRRRHRIAFQENQEYAPELTDEFISFEEYTKYREVYSTQLNHACLDLTKQPAVVDIQSTLATKVFFDQLAYTHSTVWNNMSNEKKWITYLYSRELIKRFGAISIVDKTLLPTGVMTMLREKKVTWQLILWD